jgi:hypothetical protein
VVRLISFHLEVPIGDRLECLLAAQFPFSAGAPTSLLRQSLQGDSSEFMRSLCVVGLGPVAARARGLVHEEFDRFAQAAARGATRCASQVLNRCAQAEAGGAAQVLDRVAQAVARGAAL